MKRRTAELYSKALFEVLPEQRRAEALAGLKRFEELFRSSLELRHFLHNPSFRLSDRLAVVEAVAGRLGMASHETNLLKLLVEHRRLGIMPELVESFEKRLNAALGIEVAEVAAPEAISARTLDELASSLGDLIGKKVECRVVSDPGLICGVKVKVGSYVIDASLRGQLQRLAKTLAA